jgi:transcriptional regulator with XRE-family HTH domain
MKWIEKFVTVYVYARFIRTARERAGLSQREFARLAGTTQAVAARLELGTDQRMLSLMLICRMKKPIT